MARIERVFVDSDTQHDFIDPAGRLYVPGSVEIHDALRRLIRFAEARHIPVLSPVDEHPEDDPEFTQFPPHCVRDTPGQAKLPFTLLGRVLTVRADVLPPAPAAKLVADCDQLIFPKQAFSVFTNPNFGRVVDGLDAGEFVIFGVALDYCVREVALGLLQRGRTVTIVRDAVRAITPQGEQETTRLLAARGAGWATADEILQEAICPRAV
jgi:nicotinamidase/pyrazinamidase